VTPSPFDAETTYRIKESGTPVTEDGYKHNEPKWLVCGACGATVELTPEPSAGVDELPHDPDCPQRFARSDYWEQEFRQAE
jgi:hypothetical protein